MTINYAILNKNLMHSATKISIDAYFSSDKPVDEKLTYTNEYARKNQYLW